VWWAAALVEVALVKRPLADVPRLARRAVEHVLELVRVVEDVVAARKVAQLLGGREGTGLDLEVIDELVGDTERRRLRAQREISERAQRGYEGTSATGRSDDPITGHHALSSGEQS
jgi:hypothetical protein